MKTQLTIAINNFIPSEDNNKERVMHSKIDNIKIMINGKADKVIEKHFELLLNKYQIELETSMRDSDFIFSCVNLLYYKLYYKIIFKEVDHISFVTLKPLSYCFEEIIEFDVKASFASYPLSCLIRYNKPADITEEF